MQNVTSSGQKADKLMFCFFLTNFVFFSQRCYILHFESHRQPNTIRVGAVQSPKVVYAAFEAQTLQNSAKKSQRIK